MLNIMTIAIAFFTAISAPAVMAKGAPSKAAQIPIDAGPGGDIFRKAPYQRRAAKLVNEELSAMDLGQGDKLVLKTFGNASLLDHLELVDFNREIEFSYRGARVEDVGPFIDKRIAALSEVPAHTTSDLMSGLAELDSLKICEDFDDVTTIVLTNGIEAGRLQAATLSCLARPRARQCAVGSPSSDCGSRIRRPLQV